MKEKIKRIIYWSKDHKGNFKKNIVQKKEHKVSTFVLKGGKVRYTLFITNRNQDFIIVGKYPTATSKNFLDLSIPNNNPEKKTAEELAQEFYTGMNELGSTDDHFVDMIKKKYGIEL